MKIFLPLVALTALLGANTALADEHLIRQDSKAIEVIQNMSTFTSSLDQAVIKGFSTADARLPAGLMVSNTAEGTITYRRPGSLRMTQFDGLQRKEIVFHDGKFTVFGTERNYYAQASLPENIDAALEYAIKDLELDLPLIELVYQDASKLLIRSGATIIYLTDKARINGVDCHHIAIRDDEIDYQLWVEEGARALPRQIMMTSKWEGGAPRFIANLSWDTNAEIDPAVFTFTPPEGSINIGFTGRINQEEE